MAKTKGNPNETRRVLIGFLIDFWPFLAALCCGFLVVIMWKIFPADDAVGKQLIQVLLTGVTAFGIWGFVRLIL